MMVDGKFEHYEMVSVGYHIRGEVISEFYHWREDIMSVATHK
jgi:hypothetical protein